MIERVPKRTKRESDWKTKDKNWTPTVMKCPKISMKLQEEKKISKESRRAKRRKLLRNTNQLPRTLKL